MSDQTLEEQQVRIRQLVEEAQQRDTALENQISSAETKLNYTQGDQERRNIMSEMIKMRHRLVKRWREIIDEANTLSKRLDYIGNHLQARVVRQTRDTFAAKHEDGEEDLKARQILLSKYGG
ncbi:hypothetical protein SCAR479_09948 [Seiridium cardinale]|uniref:Uncharacterized protein n=1 Tax=Seiridium cardinale TaxID=138064 RepID=A0ABR2XHW7_9PEZI